MMSRTERSGARSTLRRIAPQWPRRTRTTAQEQRTRGCHLRPPKELQQTLSENQLVRPTAKRLPGCDVDPDAAIDFGLMVAEVGFTNGSGAFQRMLPGIQNNSCLGCSYVAIEGANYTSAIATDRCVALRCLSGARERCEQEHG